MSLIRMTIIKICEFRTKFVYWRTWSELAGILRNERLFLEIAQDSKKCTAITRDELLRKKRIVRSQPLSIKILLYKVCLLCCHVDAKFHARQKEMSSSQKKKININIYSKHNYDRAWKGFWKKIIWNPITLIIHKAFPRYTTHAARMKMCWVSKKIGALSIRGVLFFSCYSQSWTSKTAQS